MDKNGQLYHWKKTQQNNCRSALRWQSFQSQAEVAISYFNTGVKYQFLRTTISFFQKKPAPSLRQYLSFAFLSISFFAAEYSSLQSNLHRMLKSSISNIAFLAVWLALRCLIIYPEISLWLGRVLYKIQLHFLRIQTLRIYNINQYGNYLICDSLKMILTNPRWLNVI